MSEMASHPLPDTDRRNSCGDSSTRLATYEYISSNQNALLEGHACEPPLFPLLLQHIQQLVPDIQWVDSASHKDVYTNASFMKFLQEMAALGRCAESDLKKCEKLQREESKVYGLTGPVIERGQEQMESGQDAADKPVEVQPLDDRWGVVKTSVQSCQEQLQHLEEFQLSICLREYTEACKTLKSNSLAPGQDEALMHQSLAQHNLMEARVKSLRSFIKKEVQGSAWSHLLKCCECFCDIMKKWRSMDAWIYGKIIAISDEQIENLLCHLEAMFQKFVDFLKSLIKVTDKDGDDRTVTIRNKIHDLENQLYSVGWYVKGKPEYCVLNRGKPIKMNLSVKLLGIKSEDIAGIDIYVFPESDCDHRHTEQYLCTDIKPTILESRGGVCVEVGQLALKNVCVQKRGSALLCEKFYRVCFLVKHATVGRPTVECLTPPFTIRTGSVQLWEFQGAVRWYCFTAVDLYGPPFKCQSEMSIPQLLTMLQAMITVTDADKKLDVNEIQAFQDMLHSLASKDKVSLRRFVKDDMPKQGRDKKKTGKNSFSCFNWFEAALNTYIYLRLNTHLRGCGVFAGYDQVKAVQMPSRCAWIRISRNSIEVPSGKSPHADVVVHVFTGTGVESLVYSYTALMKQSLSSCLTHATDSSRNRVVSSILPDGIPVEQLDKSPSNDAVNVNDYRTRTVSAEQILAADLGEMHISAEEDVPCTDQPGADSSSQLPAKRTKIHIRTSQTVPNSQAVLPSTSSDSLLPSEALTPSIDSLLPNEQMQKYSQILKPVAANMDALSKLLQQCEEEDSTWM